jgi:hypothetical protein
MSENQGYRAFTAGEELAAARRVKIKSATATTPPEVVYADADEADIGVTALAGASGALVTVRLRTCSGSVEIEAGEAFAVGAGLYGGADGKVVDTDPGSGTLRYTALEAAGSAGAIVECLVAR